MEHAFDRDYWNQHWQRDDLPPAPVSSPPDRWASTNALPAHPVLERMKDLVPGAVLDVGCGAGVEARWLAAHDWRVIGVDISAGALARAAQGAQALEPSRRPDWVEADALSFTPGQTFDLVTTFYAHPTIAQLDFYEHIAQWVVPGGTLLIVGHLAHGEAQHHGKAQHRGEAQHHGGALGHDHGTGRGHPRDGQGEDREPPVEATATAAAITARFPSPAWEVVFSEEAPRVVSMPHGGQRELQDVVVRLRRAASTPIPSAPSGGSA
ncbi:class I SAM-dependent methyltransferase [Nesterenkonia flava]|uniref:Class I SAM-dependent methyltransferase n=1 Tax=Nesterenkonia flava TaxID=469799 RepID=A0ABU1FTG3_9MICC|nr:class I SAM-dependent methyltransferase [Nesterenkonia flava]MDR5711946.1 class I SAM-dependent methyltransferase [Nesterenkonia flava]